MQKKNPGRSLVADTLCATRYLIGYTVTVEGDRPLSSVFAKTRRKLMDNYIKEWNSDKDTFLSLESFRESIRMALARVVKDLDGEVNCLKGSHRDTAIAKLDTAKQWRTDLVSYGYVSGCVCLYLLKRASTQTVGSKTPVTSGML